MIPYITLLPYPLRVAIFLVPIAYLIRTIKNIKKEGKFHLPFAICLAIEGIACIVLTSATEFSEGSRFEDIAFYIEVAWTAVFLVVTFASAIIKYKRGEISEKRLRYVRAFIGPIIVFSVIMVFSIIMAILKSP